MTTALYISGVEPKVLELLLDNPALPYSAIAGEVGVSRERVRQIARRNGYPPRNGVLKPRICPVCGDIFYTRRQYCSRACVYKARRNRMIIKCHQCGKRIERTPGNMRSKSGRYYCSRACYAKNKGTEVSEANGIKKRVIRDFEFEIVRT